METRRKFLQKIQTLTDLNKMHYNGFLVNAVSTLLCAPYVANAILHTNLEEVVIATVGAVGNMAFAMENTFATNKLDKNIGNLEKDIKQLNRQKRY